MRVGLVAAGFAAVLGTAAPAAAQAPAFFVVDSQRVIPDQVERGIESRLRQHHGRTGNHVAVMTMPSTGLTIEQFARQVFNTLDIGGKENTKGALVFVTPEDKKVRIVVGHGLARVVTEPEIKAIIDGRMLPALRANDYGRAIRAGVEGVLIELGDTAPIADVPRPDGPTDLAGGAGSELPPGVVDPTQAIEKAASTLRSLAPIFVGVLLLVGFAVMSRFFRGVGSMVSGIADAAGAAGYGRGVWFGKTPQGNPYGDPAFGQPLASGTSAGVVSAQQQQIAGGGVSGNW